MTEPKATSAAVRQWARAGLRAAPVVVVLTVLQAATIIAAAAVTGMPGAALACSVATVCAASAGWAWFRSRRGRSNTTMRWRHHAVILAAATVVASGLTYLRPAAGPPSAPDAGGFMLHLPDGSELNVRRYGGTERSGATVVSIHGGPGVPFSSAEESTLAALADTRTVITYDQIGVGFSSRLPDPTGYTLQRSVEDLAEVAATVDDEDVVLFGYSWGALTALSYAAQHPDEVAALILASPGPFPWKDRPWPSVAPQDRLPTLDKVHLYGSALSPRNLFIYTLTAVDPAVAHWFAGDTEMDARFADLYELAALGTTCDRRPIDAPESTLGYYAAQLPQLHPDGTGVGPAELDLLRAVPTLIVRGSCDYVDAQVAQTYRDQLGGRLVEIRGAGHAIADERPGELRQIVDTFLDRLSTAKPETVGEATSR